MDDPLLPDERPSGKHYSHHKDEGRPARDSLRRRRRHGPVLCDECWKDHIRTNAVKRCLDCDDNVCDNCAIDHEVAPRTPWWCPYWIATCFRFLVPSWRFIPHSVVSLVVVYDTPEVLEQCRPHWALSNEANSMCNIPRITRCSLRTKQDCVPNKSRDSNAQNSEETLPCLGNSIIPDNQPASEEPVLNTAPPLHDGMPFIRQLSAPNTNLESLLSRHNVDSNMIERVPEEFRSHSRDRDIKTVSHPDSKWRIIQKGQYATSSTSHKVPSSETEIPDTCPICLENIPDKESRKFQCGHPIHSACLAELLSKMEFDFSVKCPVCNQLTHIKNYYVPREEWIHEFLVVVSGQIKFKYTNIV
ncbi:hypothetical protein ACJMK2_010845 [Sinanodonta woodiana]|uniref:RING-type domain-containing protein n=1 Tax=Sinanodonta woodiana TaxID=1069815 RepID=A0ABD3VGQ7_SINWO